MTLSLSFPITGDPIGPGYYTQVVISAGPIPVDDYVTVQVFKTFGGPFLCAMSAVTNGGLFPFELMGVRQVGAHVGPWDPSRNMGGRIGQMSPGGTVDISVQQYHGNGTFVDVVNYTAAYTWDPTGGLGELMIRLTSGDANGLAKYLVKTFPTT